MCEHTSNARGISQSAFITFSFSQHYLAVALDKSSMLIEPRERTSDGHLLLFAVEPWREHTAQFRSVSLFSTKLLDRSGPAYTLRFWMPERQSGELAIFFLKIGCHGNVSCQIGK